MENVEKPDIPSPGPLHYVKTEYEVLPDARFKYVTLTLIRFAEIIAWMFTELSNTSHHLVYKGSNQLAPFGGGVGRTKLGTYSSAKAC